MLPSPRRQRANTAARPAAPPTDLDTELSKKGEWRESGVEEGREPLDAIDQARAGAAEAAVGVDRVIADRLRHAARAAAVADDVVQIIAGLAALRDAVAANSLPTGPADGLADPADLRGVPRQRAARALRPSPLGRRSSRAP